MPETRERVHIEIERGPRRVRTYLGGELVADTKRLKLVWEVPYYPAYYFPREDVRMELLTPNGHTQRRPSRGDAHKFTVKGGGREVEDAAWHYPESPLEALRDLIRFDWDAMDRWFEEDEEVYVHPHDPYTRIGILHSSRHVEVEVNGMKIADTHRRPSHDARMIAASQFNQHEQEIEMSESYSLPTEPEGVVTSLLERFNSGKVSAMMIGYEPEAVFIARDGRTITGHPEIAAELERDLKYGLPLKAKARHVFVAGEIAQIVLDWSIDGTGPDGKHVHLEGSASDVVRRGADGRWRYVIDNALGTAVRKPA